MKSLKYIITLFLCAAALFLLAVPAFAAENGGLFDPKGEITGIAHRGLWGDYPENTLEAFRAAKEAGLDFVLADVSGTEDGVPVIMEAHSAARMLQGAASTDTADCTLQELRALTLRKGAGGAGNGDSPCKMPTLAELLTDAAAHNYVPVLKFDVSLTETVTDELEESDGSAVLYPTGKQKDVLAAADALREKFTVIAEKRSNVIFSVLHFVKELQNSNADGAVLKTTNRYGVIYYKSTIAKCDGLRAIADTSDPVTAGARQDTQKWWDDLVSRGYSAIITDDPVGFAAYLHENDAARARLKEICLEAGNKQLPHFASPLDDYRKNYTNAMDTARALLSDFSSSAVEMRDAYAALSDAMRAIDMNFEAIDAGTAERTVTLPRILLCVGAAAAVITVQIYFYKKRKTQK